MIEIFNLKLQLQKRNWQTTSRFSRLTKLLKSYEAGYQRKCAQTFKKEEIERFLVQCPDEGIKIPLRYEK